MYQTLFCPCVSGGAGNSVEMQGNGDSALVEESSGIHLHLASVTLQVQAGLRWRLLLWSLALNLSWS